MFLTDSLAAQARSEDPRTNARMHFGSLYLTPEVSIREFGFDTNVFNEAGDRDTDFMFTVAPQLVTSLPIARRGLVRLTTAADLNYYREYASERSIDPQVALRGELYLNRLTLFAEPSYLRTRQRPNFEIDLRSRRVQQGTVTGAEFRVLPKLSTDVSISHSRTVFDADQFFLGTNLGDTLNRVSWTYGVAARWNVTPLTTFVVRGESTKDRFLISRIRNSNSTRMTAGVELKPRALISGFGRLGIRSFNMLDSGAPDFTGLAASAGLTYTLMGSTTFGLSIDRDTDYSFEPAEPYYVGTSVGVTVRRQLIGPFDGIVSLDRHRYVYQATAFGVAGIILRNRVDLTRSYSGSIGYRLSSTARLGIGFSYWTRDSSTRDFRNYDGLRIGSSFTYGR